MKVFGKNNSEDINQNEARKKSCSFALIGRTQSSSEYRKSYSEQRFWSYIYPFYMFLLMVISEGLFFHPKLEIS